MPQEDMDDHQMFLFLTEKNWEGAAAMSLLFLSGHVVRAYNIMSPTTTIPSNKTILHLFNVNASTAADPSGMLSLVLILY